MSQLSRMSMSIIISHINGNDCHENKNGLCIQYDVYIQRWHTFYLCFDEYKLINRKSLFRLLLSVFFFMSANRLSFKMSNVNLFAYKRVLNRNCVLIN